MARLLKSHNLAYLFLKPVLIEKSFIFKWLHPTNHPRPLPIVGARPVRLQRTVANRRTQYGRCNPPARVSKSAGQLITLVSHGSVDPTDEPFQARPPAPTAAAGLPRSGTRMDTVDRISTPSTVPSLLPFTSITWRQFRIHKRSEQSRVCTG